MGEQKITDDEEPSPEALEKQDTQIKELKNQTLTNGDTWYLIDSHWFKPFEQYVTNNGFGWKISKSHDHVAPGPIDNSGLFTDDSYNELKDNLSEHYNYTLVPEKAWYLLVKWYGVVEDQPPIARKVIALGITQTTNVEIYPIKLKLGCYDNKEKVFTKEISKTTTIADLEKDMRKLFEIPCDKQTRIWNAFIPDSYDELSTAADKSIADVDLQKNQLVVIEQQNDNGEWTHGGSKQKVSLSNGTYQKSTGSGWGSSSSSGTSSFSNYKLRSSSPTSMNGHYCTPGLCGLNNLGNTCFMNSALQCLSNVPALTQYFKSGCHEKELNRTNPLGMGGKLAKAYASLIQVMWSGDHSSFAPRDFKMAVGQFAPRFSGYQQHDSQELLSFLIDGLHEDLNRISAKPYIEMQEANDRPHTEVALESWDNHRKRNSSVIVDTLHGLFRSTVDCPECPRISFTFDPFCFLSLPLPVKRERSVECTFVPVDYSDDVVKYKVTVPKDGSIDDVCSAVSQYNEYPSADMTATDVYNARFHKIFKRKEGVRAIYEKDYIYIFQSPPGARMLPVYMRHVSVTGSSHLFGQPTMVPVCPNNLTYKQLYQAVLRATFRYIADEEIQDKIEKLFENDYDDEEQKMDGENETEESNCYKLFTLKVVNSFGTQEYKQLYNDDNPIKLQDGVYLAADWSKSAFEICFPKEWPKVEVMHESVKPDTKKVHGIDLHDCMKLFTSAEKLGVDDEWYCSQCKKHQQALKKFDLWMLPPILVIHFKRFSHTRYSRDKLDTLVNFPIRDLDLSEFIVNPTKESWETKKRRYNLIAVSNHYGGLGGGHYTAYAKNSVDNEWHYFDDSSVSPSSEDRVVTKAAYMLVYQRQDLEEWHSQHPNTPFSYMEMWSPRAMEATNGMSDQSPLFKFGNDINNSNMEENEDILNNNNADDSMDTT
uniref:Ubiquitin carboxyl-terminal hydrolase n=1 Tax=Phallusia mammillata TaxID=59560 RepID=A0A6F9DXF0_9ASCI|nr:ubiquitin carboxyl-terminal hydrolase 15 [Phallusia mammillata]